MNAPQAPQAPERVCAPVPGAEHPRCGCELRGRLVRGRIAHRVSCARRWVMSLSLCCSSLIAPSLAIIAFFFLKVRKCSAAPIFGHGYNS